VKIGWMDAVLQEQCLLYDLDSWGGAVCHLLNDSVLEVHAVADGKVLTRTALNPEEFGDLTCGTSLPSHHLLAVGTMKGLLQIFQWQPAVEGSTEKGVLCRLGGVKLHFLPTALSLALMEVDLQHPANTEGYQFKIAIGGCVGVTVWKATATEGQDKVRLHQSPDLWALSQISIEKEYLLNAGASVSRLALCKGNLGLFTFDGTLAVWFDVFSPARRTLWFETLLQPVTVFCWIQSVEKSVSSSLSQHASCLPQLWIATNAWVRLYSFTPPSLKGGENRLGRMQMQGSASTWNLPTATDELQNGLTVINGNRTPLPLPLPLPPILHVPCLCYSHVGWFLRLKEETVPETVPETESLPPAEKDSSSFSSSSSSSSASPWVERPWPLPLKAMTDRVLWTRCGQLWSWRETYLLWRQTHQQDEKECHHSHEPEQEPEPEHGKVIVVRTSVAEQEMLLLPMQCRYALPKQLVRMLEGICARQLTGRLTITNDRVDDQNSEDSTVCILQQDQLKVLFFSNGHWQATVQAT
jgi:hypothetical protein